MDQITKLLKHASLFHGLNENELEQIAHLAQEEHFDAHATIFSQNAPGEKMYIVGRGQVEIRVLDEHGESHTTLFLGQGQVFGEMALLDQGTRSATVLAAQPNTTVYGIDGQKLLELCQQDTRIGYVMMRNIALDLSFKIRHHNYGL